jgi:hypothetical protein
MSSAEKTELLVIVTEVLLEGTLLNDLRRLGVKGYTITDARGQGARGSRSGEWDTAGNIRIEIVCSANLAHQILEHLEKTYYRNYAMIAYHHEVSVIRPLKFR